MTKTSKRAASAEAKEPTAKKVKTETAPKVKVKPEHLKIEHYIQRLAKQVISQSAETKSMQLSEDAKNSFVDLTEFLLDLVVEQLGHILKENPDTKTISRKHIAAAIHLAFPQIIANNADVYAKKHVAKYKAASS